MNAGNLKTTDPMTVLSKDVRWMENGQSVLSGKALHLYRRLDRLFFEWAEDWNAESYHFPTFLPASELNKLDYFHSFPHLVTFPVCLDCDDENLKRFSAGSPIDPDGAMRLTQVAPVKDVLTPAACYHFYVNFQNRNFDTVKYVTTLATCFRRETHYLPLQRQWSFSMREIVCIGSAEQVQRFLSQFQERLKHFLEACGLPVKFEGATDPFFNPSKNPKYLMQKLDPVKTEMVFEERLAIGSLNYHRNYFGDAFQISTNGETAHTGCVAFGLERWIHAFIATHGERAEEIIERHLSQTV